MSDGNKIEFKAESDSRPIDIITNQTNVSAARDPAQTPAAKEAVQTVASQAPLSYENPVAPQSTQPPPLPPLPFLPAEPPSGNEVKNIVLDALKSITINGVSPQINGGSIDFNVETKPSASQQWNSANGINTPPLSPPPPPPSPPTTLTPIPLSSYSVEANNTPTNQSATPINQLTTPQDQTPQNQNQKIEAPEPDVSVFSMAKPEPLKERAMELETERIPDNEGFSMAKPKPLKERAMELEAERTLDSEGFSMAKPKAFSVNLGRNTIDDVIDQAEGEAKPINGEAPIRRGKDKIFDRIEDAIENEDFDKARKLNDRVKNRELEIELRGGGENRDRRSTKDIAESEGIDTRGKTNKEIRQEILEKRGEKLGKGEEGGVKQQLGDLRVIEAGQTVVQVIPIPVKRADDTEYQVIYAMASGYVPIKSSSTVPDTLEGDKNGDNFENTEYWIPLGGGGGGTFLASLEFNPDGTVKGVKVTAGSYHILNTNTDVEKMSGSGDYVYAIIEHSNAGIFKEFKIEISSTSKDPTNMDPTDKFVQFSNVLLAEKMTVDEKPKMIQRRTGNLSLVHQVVSGHICLWAYSSGGTSL